MLDNNFCFHCGLEINTKENYSLLINNEVRSMCCKGCLSVAKFIIDNNFCDYYTYRVGFNKTVDFNSYNDNIFYDDVLYQEKFLKKKGNFEYVILAIDGITCAACTWLIEHHLKRINGVNSVLVNLSTSRAHVSFNLSVVRLSFLINEINKLGYKSYPYSYKKIENLHNTEYKRELKKLVVAGLGMSQVMMLSASLYVGEGRDLHYVYWNFIRWINFIITTPVLFFSAWNIFFSAFNGVRYKIFGMDFTVSLSLILAYFSSVFNLFNKTGDVYFDSICMFIFFLLIGRFLEMRARHHSNNIVYSLQELTSGTTNLFVNGNVKSVLIEHVNIDDILLIKSGENVPVDAKIINGVSHFDESMLTGESIPIHKDKGDYVVSGSINLSNPVLIKAIKNAKDSTINIIINLLDEAFVAKPKFVIFSDMVANIFILIVVLLTSFVSFLWFFLSDINVLNIVLAMLVITCPCALSLATPIALTSTMNFFIKHGFLITQNNVLEVINNVTDIVFDKTGTLTLNKFVLEKIKLNSNVCINFIFSVARLLEKESNHPISNAFHNSNIDYVKNLSVYSIKNYAGMGVEGVIDNVCYRFGNPEFIKDWVETYLDIDYKGIYVILANKHSVLAWFKMTNPIRKNVKECISNLRLFNIKSHILSGDSFNNVLNISQSVGIDFFKSNASFKDKVTYIKLLQENGAVVMMIGDGINDAPALNLSNISVSMGSGMDLTKISSDAILLNNDLLIISKIIKHGKKMKNIISQNIFWAIFYNITGLFLASLNLISPYYAALGMSISSLLVVLNSLRLSRF
jgi:Cu2+-exporting ATPase